VTGGRRLRLLPWNSPEGKPVFVLGDPAHPGPVSRHADVVEATHLEMAAVLLGHAHELADEAGPAELRHLVTELTQALTDTLRIASRARR
jgi:hypothetical protein